MKRDYLPHELGESTVDAMRKVSAPSSSQNTDSTARAEGGKRPALLTRHPHRADQGGVRPPVPAQLRQGRPRREAQAGRGGRVVMMPCTISPCPVFPCIPLPPASGTCALGDALFKVAASSQCVCEREGRVSSVPHHRAKQVFSREGELSLLPPSTGREQLSTSSSSPLPAYPIVISWSVSR